MELLGWEICEIKNSLDKLNSRFDPASGKIYEFEDRAIETTQSRAWNEI